MSSCLYWFLVFLIKRRKASRSRSYLEALRGAVVDNRYNIYGFLAVMFGWAELFTSNLSSILPRALVCILTIGLENFRGGNEDCEGAAEAFMLEMLGIMAAASFIPYWSSLPLRCLTFRTTNAPRTIISGDMPVGRLKQEFLN